MAFNNLTDKLQNIFKNLKGKGKLKEEDVKLALKEIKMVLLEADVNFKVVKSFIKSIEEKAVGEEVLNGLNPAQTVIKIVRDEMTTLMGSETTEIKLQPGKATTIIMMAGLQGAGKTTTAAKLAGKFKLKGKKPLLVACDIYRPAAIEQLKINAEKQQVDFFTFGKEKPVKIVQEALKFAEKNNNNLVIIDTAGRLHIDEDMMNELKEIKENIEVHQTILVVDAMTGQDAVNVATTFNEQIEIDGVILTKVDGDTRGGAALSIKHITGKPILYVGMGEKLSDLEQFYPDRMTSRILGMGDVLTLIDKMSTEIDEDKAKQLSQKMKKNEFDLEDFLESFNQMDKLGGLEGIMKLMPNMPNMGNLSGIDIDEKKIAKQKAIIYSMTPEERRNPDLLNASRRRRIAAGCGQTVQDVNILIKQYNNSKQMMKQMGMMGGKPKMPFGKKGRFGKFF